MNRLALTVLALPACATSHDLLGDDLDAVRARLGPPLCATAGGGVWQLGYLDTHGREVPDAVIVVDDVVVRVAPDLVPAATGGPDTDNLTGARIETVLARLGPARSCTFGTDGTTLQFGDRTLQVIDGRVLDR